MEEILSEELKVISYMFSNGAGILEARPSELKGLMRYIYRIASVEEDTVELYYRESELFGGKIKKEKLKASPLKVFMTEDRSQKNFDIEKRLVVHKNKTEQKCFKAGKIFDLKLFYHDNCTDNNFDYKSLCYLSLIIGGIGKRVRRGRGCMTVKDIKCMSKEDQIKFVTQQLNLLNNYGKSSCAEIYEIYDHEIRNNQYCSYDDNKKYKRPIIEKIIFGKKNIDKIDEYLKKVDTACHEIKKDSKYNKFATGYTRNGKLSSSVIVSITKTSDGLYPIYTFVTPVIEEGKYLDKGYGERKTFFEKIEGR